MELDNLVKCGDNIMNNGKNLQMSIELLKKEAEELRVLTTEAKDAALKMEFTRKFLEIQKQIKQIQEELAIIETPIQQLLPDIFEEKRAIPNSFLRGALFGIVKKGKRALVKDEKIFSMSQYDIIFSGEYLDQNDLELWDTLIFLAKKHSNNNQLKLTLYEIIKTLRIQDTGTNRKAILKRIERLKFGMLKISKADRVYYGNLIQDAFIDEVDGKFIINFNNSLVNSFSDKDFTLINVTIRQMLGDDQLARWLYNFYESHTIPIPFKIEFLKNLCRSETELKDFRYKLKKALTLVKQAHLATDSSWDYEIIDDQLFIYKTGKLKNKDTQPKLL